MNTRTYTLSSSTLDATFLVHGHHLATGDSLYEEGATDLVISFGGVNDVSATYNYTKFLVQYDDDPKIYTVESSTADITDISAQTIRRAFYPSERENTTQYKVTLSGVRTSDFNIDEYNLYVNIGKSPMQDYDLQMVNSYLYSNTEDQNNLMLTMESQHERHIGNVIIPFVKNKVVYLPTPAPVFVPNENTYLRTELYTWGGGLVPMITHFRGNWWEHHNQEYIIKESQISWLVMGTEDSIVNRGTELQSLCAGQGANQIIGLYNGGILYVDINGHKHILPDSAGPAGSNDPAQIHEELILIPEQGINYDTATVSGPNPDPGIIRVGTHWLAGNALIHGIWPQGVVVADVRGVNIHGEVVYTV